MLSHTAPAWPQFEPTRLAPSCVHVGEVTDCRRTGAENPMSPFPPPGSPNCPPRSCHLSSWQHKVIASRCNQDDMLVTHSVHTAPRYV